MLCSFFPPPLPSWWLDIRFDDTLIFWAVSSCFAGTDVGLAATGWRAVAEQWAEEAAAEVSRIAVVRSPECNDCLNSCFSSSAVRLFMPTSLPSCRAENMCSIAAISTFETAPVLSAQTVSVESLPWDGVLEASSLKAIPMLHCFPYWVSFQFRPSTLFTSRFRVVKLLANPFPSYPFQDILCAGTMGSLPPFEDWLFLVVSKSLVQEFFWKFLKTCC